jgi:hypothetical protein
MPSKVEARVFNGRQLWEVVEPFAKESLQKTYDLHEDNVDYIKHFSVNLSLDEMSVIEGEHESGSFLITLTEQERDNLWKALHKKLAVQIKYVVSMYLDADVRPNDSIPTMSVKFYPFHDGSVPVTTAKDGTSDLVYKDYKGNAYTREEADAEGWEELDK